MNKVSVVMPVYNVVDYVETSLRSVMTQSYQDLEILICDDGSTDGSGEVCDRLAVEDARIKVVHTENRGVSAARNTCLDMATGEYITSVDPDDLISRDYVERMVLACASYDADVALCDYCRLDESARTMPKISHRADEEMPYQVYTNTECLEQMYHPTSLGMNYAVCFKLFRRRLFENPPVRYPVGKIHEDLFTTWKLIYGAHHVVYLEEPLYGYRIRGGSTMTKAFRIERTAVVEATKETCDYYLSHGEGRLAALAVNYHIRTEFSMIANLRTIHTDVAHEMEQQILEQLRTDCKQYLPRVDLPCYKKLVYSATAMFPLRPLVQKLRMY